jgi:tetratricopeptide (TPR) repeat protein
MKSKIKNLIVVFVAVLIIVAISLYGFLYTKKDDQHILYKSNVFELVDDEEGIVIFEQTDLSQTSKDEYNKRIKILEQEIATSSEEDEERDVPYYNLATYERYLGNYGQSYEALIKSIEIYPENRLSWTSLGETLKAMKAYKSAQIAYEKALDINTGTPDTYVKLADLFAVAYPEDLEKAKQVYEQGIEVVFADKTLRNSYAIWLERKNFKPEAIEQYQILIKIDPDNTASYEETIKFLLQ